MDSLVDYKKSFLFGIKFVLLVVMLIVPLVVSVSIGFGLYSALLKLPILSKKSLIIESVYEYADETKLNADFLQKLKANKALISLANDKNERVYVVVNRRDTNKTERQEILDSVNRIVRNNQIKRVFNVDENGISAEGYLTQMTLWTPDAWNKNVIWEGLSVLGGWVLGLLYFVLFVLGVACYFPIFKGFINLFKHKRIL